jgi:hypothetical protein
VTSPSSYDDLVTAATVGLSRRPLPVTALAGPAAGHADVIAPGDAADALLDAAALHVAARRAGMVPPRGVAAPPPMASDPAPEVPPRAAQELRRALPDADLLADLLTAAADAGFRAPAPLLPVLLDAATRTVALRPAVTATLGGRGRWLAEHRPDWKRIAGVEATAGDAAAEDPRTWETGGRADRVAYLTALRGRDPLAARELLAAGWSREIAEERAQLLVVLSQGLSLADEEFLEAALDDRAAVVRAAARSLLGVLPGSAFGRRAAGRAGAVLRMRSDGKRRWLEATLPDGPPGPDLARDGITASPPATGVGARAWLLTELIAAAPLGEWTRRFGAGAQEVVSLEVRLAPDPASDPGARKDRAAAGGLSVEVHAGWRRAAMRQGDPQWAAALLSGDGPLLAPDWPQGAWTGNHELATLLDPGTRAALAQGVFTRVTEAARALEGKKSGSRASATAIAEFAAWPGPWPAGVADFVLRMVAASLSAQGAVRVLQGLLSAAARNIPVDGSRDYGAELIRMANAPDCAYPWLAVLRRAADTLALRRAFHAAIAAGH